MAKAKKRANPRAPSSMKDAPTFWKEEYEAIKQHHREFEVRYCSGVPRKPLPQGRVLVHNHIAHTKDMPVGVNGFRIWTQKAEPDRLVLCRCGWRGVTHYHVRGLGSHKSFTPAKFEELHRQDDERRARRAARRLI